MMSFSVRTYAVFLALITALTAAPHARAQVPCAQRDSLISAAAVRADLAHLYKSLESAHFDLFVHRPRAEYDRRYQEALASIDGPMSRIDVVRLFARFVAFGNIGHANVSFPVQDYIAYAQAGGTLIPLDVRVHDGRVLVVHAYTTVGETALRPGTELLTINGTSTHDWVSRLGELVAAERAYMDHALLEGMFPRLFWLDQGRVDTFQVTVRAATGGDTTLTLAAVSVMDVERRKGALESVHHRRSAEMLPGKIAYLRPGPFYARSADETLATFEAFIDSAYGAFIRADAEALLLDLRDNPGGDNSFSDPVVAWFAARPFRFASEFAIKASPETRRVLRAAATGEPGGISAEMLAVMDEHGDGERFIFDLPLVAPRGGRRFTRPVYALVNRHSYSNATVTAAIIQDYGFGKVLGEETSDLPTSYASSAQFALPNTGIAVTYPKGYFVRPSGLRAVQGVVPDHVIESPIATGDDDPLLRKALKLVGSSVRAHTVNK